MVNILLLLGSKGQILIRAFPYGVLGQVWYLNDTIPDLYILPDFKNTVIKYRIYLMI